MSSSLCRFFGPLPAVLGVALLHAGSAPAAPTLRVQVDQRGDFTVIGNTLGYDCGANAPAPVVGTVPAGAQCGTNITDSAPDVHWRSDDAAGTAAASTAILAADARSSAVLVLPMGATVTHAFLYWAAKSATGADESVTFEKLDAGGQIVGTANVVADPADQFTLPSGTDTFYQSVADVTSFVQAQGDGSYRVSDVDSVNFPNRNNQTDFAAWTLVVLYELPSDPPRNLVIFDGLDQVQNGSPASASLVGFVVPLAGFDAKLGVIAYEGDGGITGDQLRFGVAPLGNANALSDDNNPANNFFNGTRSFLGTAVSVPGDLPQLTGGPRSMAGYDLDVVDITDRLVAGQTSADIQATSTQDLYLLGAFITSISTYRPDLSTSGKTVEDLNGGALLVGDTLRFTITAVNTGNDNAVGVVMTDPLPPQVDFVPGSIAITVGANDGPKTDVPGDDQAEYDEIGHTVTVRLGAGADAVSGGLLAAGESTTVEFDVTVRLDANGVISNQALLSFEGEQGSPPETTPTDGNGDEPGAPPTELEIDECETDLDCGDPALPACDTSALPHECVECVDNSYCAAPTPVCNLVDRQCVGCVSDADCAVPTPACDPVAEVCVECIDDTHCVGTNSTCDPLTQLCECVPVSGGEVCGNDIDEDCDGVLDNGCECIEDADCPGLPNDGIVCDIGESYTCVPGCRGVGTDVGCPVGQLCSSTSAALGECETDPGTGGSGTGGSGTGGSGTGGSGLAAADPSGELFARGGCGCVVRGDAHERHPLWLGLLALLGLLVRRRRSVA